MENLITVLPITYFQKNQYIKFIENQENLISNIKGFTAATLERHYFKNFNDNFPRFNIHQLNSIPDSINGIKLDTADKENILLGEIEKVKEYSKSLKTFSIEEGKLKYYNLENNPIEIRNVTTDDTLKFHTNSIPRMYDDLNSDFIKIIPATLDQKKQFIEHAECLMYQLKPLIPYPELTKEQLDSIPDYIDGNQFNDLNKKNLLFEQYVPHSNNPNQKISDVITYSVSYDGQLIRSFEDKNKNIKHGNPYYKNISFVKKDDSIYVNKIISQDNSNTIREPREIYQPTKKKRMNLKEYKNLTPNTENNMSAKEDFEKAKDLDIVGFERPLKVNDPILIKQDGKNLIGKIIAFQEDGKVDLLISNSRDIKELTVEKNTKINPLFVLDKNEKMVYLKFTYEEAKAALYNNEENKQIAFKNNPAEKSPIFNLMLGNKTDVIPFEKSIEGKMHPVEGRLELRRKSGTGEAYVHGEVKHKEVNLSQPIYGLEFNDKQKEDLLSKKDIGLVSGFKTNEGKEFSLWVSLDEKLNKVVTAPERSININMIFGVKTTEEQRNQIKSGEGATIKIKDKEYLFKASAATVKADGLKSVVIENKKDLKENKAEEQKKNKGKGMKM